MPDLSERTRIPAPLAQLWPLLSDPATVASCIPGAELSADSADGVWRGSVRVRFGPTVAIFRGEATLEFAQFRLALGLSETDYSADDGKRKARGTVPASTPESDALSKDLKQRGFTFVGSTIMYAFMQATGMVDDHLLTCPAKKRQ